MQQSFRLMILLSELRSALRIMEELAEQAENNIADLIEKAELPGALEISEYEDEVEDEDGQVYCTKTEVYSYGPCSSVFEDEVVLEYKHLISNLNRRSVFLTIYGLFEHHINKLIPDLISISGYAAADRDAILKKINDAFLFRGFEFLQGDIYHLSGLRNSLANNNGEFAHVVSELQKGMVLERKQQRSWDSVNYLLSKDSGVTLNCFNEVSLSEGFLKYTINEINLYFEQMDKGFNSLC